MGRSDVVTFHNNKLTLSGPDIQVSDMAPDFRLITRSIFIIDRDGRIAYREIVKEIASHPDYDRAIAAARKLGA